MIHPNSTQVMQEIEAADKTPKKLSRIVNVSAQLPAAPFRVPFGYLLDVLG
jgi:hypothetical protein